MNETDEDLARLGTLLERSYALAGPHLEARLDRLLEDLEALGERRIWQPEPARLLLVIAGALLAAGIGIGVIAAAVAVLPAAYEQARILLSATPPDRRTFRSVTIAIIFKAARPTNAAADFDSIGGVGMGGMSGGIGGAIHAAGVAK